MFMIMLQKSRNQPNNGDSRETLSSVHTVRTISVCSQVRTEGNVYRNLKLKP